MKLQKTALKLKDGEKLDYENPKDREITLKITADDGKGQANSQVSRNIKIIVENIDETLLDKLEQLKSTKAQIEAQEYQGANGADKFVNPHSYIETKDLPYFFACFEGPGYQYNHHSNAEVG